MIETGRDSETGDDIQTEIESLTRPRYSYTDADYLAGVTRGTSRRWLSGYTSFDAKHQRVAQPPVTLGVEREGGVSFLDLVEVVAIGRLRTLGWTLGHIRQIVRNCQDLLRVDRPLVTLRFKTGGREIFVDRGEVLLEVGRRKRMQAWNEVLGPFLEELDYDAHELARRWWPLGKTAPILVDPDQGFNVSKEEVQRALQFELNRAA